MCARRLELQGERSNLRLCREGAFTSGLHRVRSLIWGVQDISRRVVGVRLSHLQRDELAQRQPRTRTSTAKPSSSSSSRSATAKSQASVPKATTAGQRARSADPKRRWRHQIRWARRAGQLRTGWTNRFSNATIGGDSVRATLPRHAQIYRLPMQHAVDPAKCFEAETLHRQTVIICLLKRLPDGRHTGSTVVQSIQR